MIIQLRYTKPNQIGFTGIRQIETISHSQYDNR